MSASFLNLQYKELLQKFNNYDEYAKSIKNISTYLTLKQEQTEQNFKPLLNWAEKNSVDILKFPRDQTLLYNMDTLDISQYNLTHFPKALGELKNLTKLDIITNRLNEIPIWIKNLNNLTELSIYKNQITNIPTWISDLQNLTKLDIGKNQLREIPIKRNTRLDGRA